MTETMASAASSTTTAPMLETRNIFKSFGSVQALTDVDFEVRAGEVMALVGDNGAGKSTLIKAIAGIHPIDEGEIFFEGKKVSIRPEGRRQARHRGRLPGSRARDNLDVVQNMFLGREARDIIWRLKESVMEAKTAQTLKSLSVTTIRSIRQQVASLSGGQRQSVASDGRSCGTRASSSSTSRPPRSASPRLARSSISSSGSPTRASRRPHLAQPARHLRGADRITVLRLGRNAAPVRAPRGDPAGGRPCHHRWRPDQGGGR